MQNARKLVSIAESIPCDVELCYGRYVVNAKSMLGVLSMPEFDEGELHIHTDNEKECEKILFQLLDFLLVSNAETLFLVNDQKPQILILHILRKNSVSTDHNVYLSFFQILQSLFLLGRCTESAKQIHAHRKLLHSLDKGDRKSVV